MAKVLVSSITRGRAPWPQASHVAHEELYVFRDLLARQGHTVSYITSRKWASQGAPGAIWSGDMDAIMQHDIYVRFCTEHHWFGGYFPAEGIRRIKAELAMLRAGRPMYRYIADPFYPREQLDDPVRYHRTKRNTPYEVDITLDDLRELTECHQVPVMPAFYDVYHRLINERPSAHTRLEAKQPLQDWVFLPVIHHWHSHITARVGHVARPKRSDWVTDVIYAGAPKASRMRQLKDLLTQFPYDKYRLLMVGRFKALAEQYPGPTYIGPLPLHEVEALYRQSGAAILLADYGHKAFPLLHREIHYMAFGLPYVAHHSIAKPHMLSWHSSHSLREALDDLLS